MPSQRTSRPQLGDVAALAGVSTATVSLVLRGRPGPGAETREAVLAAARDLAYRPDRTASLLARRRSQLLGLTVDVSSPFHADLLEDIEAAGARQGYDVVVSPLTRTRGERRAVESLLDSRCEALLLLGPSLPDVELTALAAERPVVAIGRRMAAPGVDVVRAADDRGVALAVEHLVGLGHRDIAFVDGPRGPIATLRRQGYRQAMRRLGCADTVRVMAGGDTEEAGALSARTMSRSDLASGEASPSALVAFNDRCALGIMDRLRRDGVTVPGSVSLVGYDDSPVARLGAIDLTTVSQDPETMAEAAVAAAVERLDAGRTTPTEVVLDPHLVVRGTTAPPRSG